MTENEALKALRMEGCIEITGKASRVAEFIAGIETADKALKEIQAYRAMDQRLKKIYGEFDDLLETVITYLENHNGIDFPGSVGKSRLLTDGDVDRWEAYKALGTVEECREAVERMKQ